MESLARCFYCGDSVEPGSPSTYQRVVGWERHGLRRPSGIRGGSDISLRELRAEWACPVCIDRLKHGVSPAQEELLG
jgi:hypothetical protein